MFLVIGIRKKKPIKSVKKLGTINKTAAKEMDAQDKRNDSE